MSGEANRSLLIKQDLNALNTHNFRRPIKHGHCLWTEHSKRIARQTRCLNCWKYEKTPGDEFLSYLRVGKGRTVLSVNDYDEETKLFETARALIRAQSYVNRRTMVTYKNVHQHYQLTPQRLAQCRADWKSRVGGNEFVCWGHVSRPVGFRGVRHSQKSDALRGLPFPPRPSFPRSVERYFVHPGF